MISETNGENFEYDEQIESSDERYESSGESDEASFESDESDEASFESDESDEASFESDESDEASFESDESDEAYAESDEAIESDESVSASLSARARADQDQARRQRAAFAASVLRDQQREAQRAALARRQFSNRLKAIPAGGRTVGRLQGAGQVTAVLENGRKARMRLIPAPATNAEVNRLRAVFNANDKRQARAIAKLKTAQAAFIAKQTAEMVKSDKALSKKIVESHNKLDQKITAQMAQQKALLAKQRKQLLRVAKKGRRRQLLNTLLVAETLPLYAAYGDRSKLLSGRNLLIGGSLLGNLVIDDILDGLLATGKSARTWSTLTGAWSILALGVHPAIVIGALRNKQNQRFVTDVTDISATGTTGKIQVKVASGYEADFKKLTSVPAVVTVVSHGESTAPQIVSAAVTNGELQVTFDAAPTKPVKVAYVVDTQASAN